MPSLISCHRYAGWSLAFVFMNLLIGGPGMTGRVWADCNLEGSFRAVSSNRTVELNVVFDRNKGQFTIKRNGALAAKGDLDVSGHHLAGIIDNQGRFFALHDEYEGLTVYSATGRILERFKSSELLSMREQRTRPGKWACHGEGSWSQSVSFDAGETSVIVHTHAGRVVKIELTSAENMLRVVHEHDYAQMAQVAGALVALLASAAALTFALWRWRKPKQVPPSIRPGMAT